MLMLRLLVAICALSAAQALAQAWPARPVRLIVPFPPGGSTDVAARTLADKLTRSLGTQFVVENRAGGGGAIGTSAVARAAPDGYTILFAADPVTTLFLVVKNLEFDILRDFTPVTQVTTQPLAVAVHASVPAATVQELIAYAKANPGKLSFAHSGTGTGQHFSGELLKKMAGIDIVHVPYKGGGPAVQDLVAGQVPMGVLGSTPLIPHHKSGRIRILAFTSRDRFAPMPEIPDAARVRLRRLRYQPVARPARAARHAGGRRSAAARRDRRNARARRRARAPRAGGAAARRQHAARVRRGDPRRHRALGQARAGARHPAAVATTLR